MTKKIIVVVIGVVSILLLLLKGSDFCFLISSDRVVAEAIESRDPRYLLSILRDDYMPSGARAKAWVGLADFMNETGIDVLLPNAELDELSTSFPEYFQHGEAGLYAYPQTGGQLNPYIVNIVTNEQYHVATRVAIYRHAVRRHEHSKKTCKQLHELISAFPEKEASICQMELSKMVAGPCTSPGPCRVAPAGSGRENRK